MTHAEVRKRLGQRASRAKHVGSSVDDGDASSARDARHHAAVRPLLGRRQRALHLHLRVWWQHPPRRGDGSRPAPSRPRRVFFPRGSTRGHRRTRFEDEVRVSRDAALKQTEIQGRLREHHLRALHLRGDAHEEFRSVFADADERATAPRLTSSATSSTTHAAEPPARSSRTAGTPAPTPSPASVSSRARTNHPCPRQAAHAASPLLVSRISRS